jgi:hypothetical protein
MLLSFFDEGVSNVAHWCVERSISDNTASKVFLLRIETK